MPRLLAAIARDALPAFSTAGRAGAPSGRRGSGRAFLGRIRSTLRDGFAPGRLASIGLLAVLTGLSGFALWGATSTYEAGVAARHATELSILFDNARFAASVEEALEQRYRAEPTEQVRASYDRAGTALLEALRKAAARGDPADRQVLREVLAKHARYGQAVERMFAAVDAHGTAIASAIDESEVDPKFAAMAADVGRLASRHQAAAANHLASLEAVHTKVLTATPIVFALGVVLIIGFWKTIRTFQRRAEESLAREAANIRSSERRLRGLVQNTSDLILICSAPGTVTYQSPAAETTWGYSASELVGEPVMGLVHPDDKPALHEVWEQLRDAGGGGAEIVTRAIELRLADGAGKWRAAEFVGTNRLGDPAIRGVVVTVRDITERKAFEQQLTQRAFYDALTGLPNRILFRDRLEQALVRATRRAGLVGLLFLDLDNFKLVNDSLGHQAGDQLLIEAASRLRDCVRSQDTVARLSGDEFVVILDPLAAEDDAVPIAKAIADRFALPFLLDGREVVVTASVGIAVSGAGQQHAEGLLRDADVAMYRAKNEGRARHVVFNPSMNTDSLARLELENGLRHALDHGEMRVHYQPIVDLQTGALTEVEALVRWQHPTRGLVSPGEFIPLAEETGLIVPIGLWVLNEACRQVAAWNAKSGSSPPLTLSVNLSPRQFQQPTMVADVALALRASGLPGRCLKLEITEGMIMRDAECTIRTLWELKSLGLQLAIDDFGTGYSSLSYLKRLPLDVLKIDRSFVNGIGQSQEDTAIVHAIMALAKSLNLKVTGEGVESANQATLLGKLGCDRGQGYLFSKPVDVQKVEQLLAAEINFLATGKSESPQDQAGAPAHDAAAPKPVLEGAVR